MATAPFEGRLKKKIQETKTISVAYRTDALPLLLRRRRQEAAAGYTVDLCRSIIGVIERADRRLAARR